MNLTDDKVSCWGKLEQTRVEFQRHDKMFLPRNGIWRYRLQNVVHFHQNLDALGSTNTSIFHQQIPYWHGFTSIMTRYDIVVIYYNTQMTYIRQAVQKRCQLWFLRILLLSNVCTITNDNKPYGISIWLTEKSPVFECHFITRCVSVLRYSVLLFTRNILRTHWAYMYMVNIIQ